MNRLKVLKFKMRTYLILTILCFTTIIAFGQKLQLEKASPFAAVKWEKEQPIVKFENEWYLFEKLDHLSRKEILDFCKIEYGDKWRKRFSEDLVDVLKGLGYQPNLKVNLQLSQNGISRIKKGTFTFENRQLSLHYNRTLKKSKFPQRLSKSEALADLNEFKEILETRSSYAQLSKFDYISAIEELKTSILNKKSDIDIDEFTNESCQYALDNLKRAEMPCEKYRYSIILYYMSKVFDGINIRVNKNHPRRTQFRDFIG